MAYDKDSVISTDGAEVVGNDANRFDVWRQSDTIGPTPSTPDAPPPETSGGEGGPPKAG